MVLRLDLCAFYLIPPAECKRNLQIFQYFFDPPARPRIGTNLESAKSCPRVLKALLLARLNVAKVIYFIVKVTLPFCSTAYSPPLPPLLLPIQPALCVFEGREANLLRRQSSFSGCFPQGKSCVPAKRA